MATIYKCKRCRSTRVQLMTWARQSEDGTLEVPEGEELAFERYDDGEVHGLSIVYCESCRTHDGAVVETLPLSALTDRAVQAVVEVLAKYDIRGPAFLPERGPEDFARQVVQGYCGGLDEDEILGLTSQAFAQALAAGGAVGGFVHAAAHRAAWEVHRAMESLGVQS